MKLKLKKNSSIRKNGLYDLEKIFGDCDGHGCGFGGEDISWYLSNYKKSTYDRLDISEENGKIIVSIQKVYNDDITDPEDLDVNDMPKKWQNKFNKFVKEHCLK
jgi:hypothetical protein